MNNQNDSELPGESDDGSISETQAPGPSNDEAEAPELFKVAVRRGIMRVNRPWLEIGVSGFVAGMNVAFGALAASAVAGAVTASFGQQTEMFAAVMGAMVFPIGFVFVIVGRSELFTENFLVPTASVIAHKATFKSLCRLWCITLIGNLLGAFTVANMVALEHYHGVPAVHTVAHIHEIAEFLALERDWDASFVAGIFAGWLITLMTWLLLTSNATLSKIAIIWCVGFMIMLSTFNHVVVNGAEILMAIFTNHQYITYGDWFFNNFIPTLLGNMTGGLVFVTLLEYLKVLRSTERWI